MKPERIALISAVLLTAALPADATTETRQSYEATAFSLDGDELLYRERHVETWRDGRLAEREVRYEDPDGELIAEKLVRYGEAAAAPSFEMTDYRIGLVEGAEVGPGRVVLYSGPVEEGARRRSLERPELAVVDAGFDAFMRENFAAVVAGEKIEFDFAVPASRRFFRFQLVPEGETSYRGEPAYRVKMRPASKLLRILADPIELVYSPAGRLLEFRGLANVCDENGDRYKARIAFQYPESGPAPSPVDALAAGAAE